MKIGELQENFRRVGNGVTLADPAQFAGYRAAGDILLRVNGLLIDIRIDAQHPVGRNDPAGICDVVIESAWWDPGIIRKMSRRHALHTDASHRFERGADRQHAHQGPTRSRIFRKGENRAREHKPKADDGSESLRRRVHRGVGRDQADLDRRHASADGDAGERAVHAARRRVRAAEEHPLERLGRVDQGRRLRDGIKRSMDEKRVDAA